MEDWSATILSSALMVIMSVNISFVYYDAYFRVVLVYGERKLSFQMHGATFV
jgi:hypothetical protein